MYEFGREREREKERERFRKIISYGKITSTFTLRVTFSRVRREEITLAGQQNWRQRPLSYNINSTCSPAHFSAELTAEWACIHGKQNEAAAAIEAEARVKVAETRLLPIPTSPNRVIQVLLCEASTFHPPAPLSPFFLSIANSNITTSGYKLAPVESCSFAPQHVPTNPPVFY